MKKKIKNSIGKYNVVYKGKEMTATLLQNGTVILPDGKEVALTKEQFKTAREELRKAEKAETLVTPLIGSSKPKKREGKTGGKLSMIVSGLLGALLVILVFIVLLSLGIISPEVFGFAAGIAPVIP